MRLEASLVGAVFALVLVASGAGAHLGPVHVETEDASLVPEPACVPTCEVQMTRAGNAPAVTVVETGENVTWTALEGYHTVTSDDGTTDKETLIVDGEPTSPAQACLDAGVFTSATAEFRVNGSDLEALQWDAEDPRWRTCEEAIALGEDRFLLSYHCNIHPRNQNSALLVRPAT